MAATAPTTEPIPRVTDDEKQGAIAADITARDSAPGSTTGTIVETGDASKLESGEAVAKPAPGPGLQIPDGGLDAWLVVLGGWLILFCTFGSVNAFGVYQTYYVRTLGKSDSEVAWIGSFQLWLQFTAGIVVGPVFDNGHGRKLMIGGSVLYIICLFMLSLCKEYYQVFLAQGVGCVDSAIRAMPRRTLTFFIAELVFLSASCSCRASQSSHNGSQSAGHLPQASLLAVPASVASHSQVRLVVFMFCSILTLFTSHDQPATGVSRLRIHRPRDRIFDHWLPHHCMRAHQVPYSWSQAPTTAHATPRTEHQGHCTASCIPGHDRWSLLHHGTLHRFVSRAGLANLSIVGSFPAHLLHA